MMRARENPFRTDAVLRQRYQFADGGSLPSLIERFESLGRRAAIVGRKGRGKTTLLEDLADELQVNGRQTVWLRLNVENRMQAPQLCRSVLATASRDSVLMVDGAEQLGWLHWHRFCRRAQHFHGLLITTHRPGRLAELIRCRTSPDLLSDLVRNIAPAQFDDVEASLTELYERHKGNARLCLRELYDRHADREKKVSGPFSCQ